MPIDRDGFPSKLQFLNLEFSRFSFEEALGEVAKRSVQPRFSYVVTPNVDHIVKLNEKTESPITLEFQAAYADADLRLCDSRILSRLALVFGLHLVVVTGSDLTAALFERVVSKGNKVAIIGGNLDTVSRLSALFPGPEFVQHIPPMGILSNSVAMQFAEDFVGGCKAEFNLFAIGAPQSEILAHRCAMRGLASGVGLCIGASIDFLLGDQRRAPVWMRRAGLEWAYRLASDPKRLWRRYLVEGARPDPINGLGLILAVRADPLCFRALYQLQINRDLPKHIGGNADYRTCGENAATFSPPGDCQ
jgi:N-acetylglucosaminyldiphosphoundecaprenol N-acetyl-beta-D-mannosaminyltransferase